MVYLYDLFILSCNSAVVSIPSKILEWVSLSVGETLPTLVEYRLSTLLGRLETLVARNRDRSINEWRCMWAFRNGFD